MPASNDILRNMLELANGRPVLGTEYAYGLLAEQILAETATGTHGAGLMFNDGLVAGKRYRLQLDNPNLITGLVLENGGLAGVTAPVSGTYSLFADGVLVDSGVGFIVGAVSPQLVTSPTQMDFTLPAVTVDVAQPVTSLSVVGCTVPMLLPQVTVSLAVSQLPAKISTSRTYVVPTDTSISIYGAGVARPFVWIMDPDAILDFAWDWGDWLAEVDDALESVSVPSGAQIQVLASGVVGTKSVCVLTGIEPGTWPLTFSIVTAAGRRDDRTIFLEVRNR